MCGILGVWNCDNAAGELVYGLTALQHRGQDAAGVVTFDGSFHIKKGHGLVERVFQDKHLRRLRGSSGLGHVRYATMGSTDVLDAQPIYVNYPYGLAMVHNGNVVNFAEVRETLRHEHHRLVDTSNDVALILYTLAAHLESMDLRTLSVDELFSCVEKTQTEVCGAYSAITVIANKGLLAFTDPHGFRPLTLGSKETDGGTCYALASESTFFDYMGYEILGDLSPGEALFIDAQGTIHRHQGPRERSAFCVFEYIYFAREDSLLRNRLVADERVRMGHALANAVQSAGLQPDTIIDVPASSYFFASALAEALDVPYRRGLAKNPHVGRSFITPTQTQRERVVHQKLNPIRSVIRDRKVAVVDDSIVRGTTSRRLVDMLRAAGAKEVYFISAAPPVRFPCVYGIDMSTHEELVASERSVEQIRRIIGADALVYQPVETLESLYADLGCCTACFSGTYPTGDHPDLLARIAQEKADSDR